LISTPVLILPGYGGSGPGHWQSLWERAHPDFRRVEERDWDVPDRTEWVAALDKAVKASGPETLLVAHSLACLQVVHWALQNGKREERTRLRIRGALLVAVPDPASPVFPEVARSFAPVPRLPLPFPSVVVGSSNDPFATPEFTEACARAWGAHRVSIGPAGHINADSGLGEWRKGLKLLESLQE
jgi:predicted alpha/beta hydrolase family esterase